MNEEYKCVCDVKYICCKSTESALWFLFFVFFLYFQGLEACVKILIYSPYVEKEKEFSESSVFKV